jgi:hypothetical protein
MPLAYLNVDVINPSTINNVTVSGVVIDSPTTDSIAVGTNALQSITTGIQNIAIGTDALSAVTIYTSSTAVGDSALKNINDGQNDAFGFNSLLGLTTGFYNLGLGGNSGRELVSGTRNTFVGFAAGSMFTGTGDNNVALGYQNGYVGTGGNGNNNTFIGADAGFSYHGGNDNVVVGRFTPIAAIITGNNNIQIGKDATKASLTASNSITLGNTAHNILRCAVTSITSLSDARDKKGIAELSAGLDFVNTLKPVSFVWDDRNEEGRHDVKDFGFIAQDLKKSQEDAKLADTLKLVYEENPEKLEASYGKLIPILVKAIQELSKELNELKNK